MKAGWSSTTIGDLSEVVTKGTTPTSVGFTFQDHGVNFIKVEALREDGTFKPEKFARVSADCHNALKRSQLHAGDILFSIAGALGRTALITPEVLPANTNQALSIIRLKEGAPIDRGFLAYCLSSGALIEQIEKARGGVAQQNLSLSQLKGFEIPLPPLEEQQRIVAILDEAFEGLARAKANAEANLASAKELFENFISGLMEHDQSEWVIHSFSDASVVQIEDGDRGANYPNKSEFTGTGYCVFLNTKNVRPDGFEFSDVAFISKTRDQLLRKGRLRPRDIVLTTRGTVGNVAFFDETVPFNQLRINSGMLILRPNEDKVRAEFLFELFKSGVMKSQIAEHISGAAQPQLPIRSLKKFHLPAPVSLERQLEVVARANQMARSHQELEGRYRDQVAAIDNLRQSLLQKAFAGELT